jgi:hypothetical protein
MSQIRTYYWVPEKCMFENGGDCLDKYPDLGPAAMVASHVAYDELKADALKLVGALNYIASYGPGSKAAQDTLEEWFKKYGDSK